MKVKELKELLERVGNDELEVFIRNSNNICGNIGELEQVEKTNYGFFGTAIPCIVLNTQYTRKKLEMNKKGEFINYDENDGR